MTNSTSQTTTSQQKSSPPPRAIEVGFPIVEINRLAEPERNSFKPIYQMHKWFARRASCVFRAVLLGALKPAYKEDGTPIDLMEEFYKDHSDDPDTKGKVVLDPFMGGGTTVVEALRLGCKVVGIDLNPVAWFIVKTEVEPVEIEPLKEAFDRLAARPVAWNDGKPLPEPDVRLVCIGKCLELYSAHYDRVLDHEGKTYPLHKALQDISSIVDQLVTREHPLPPELENVEGITYAWLKLLAQHRREVAVDKISKSTRALQVSVEDLKKAGLIVRGRTGRGRTYEVKQPRERLGALLERLQEKISPTTTEWIVFH